MSPDEMRVKILTLLGWTNLTRSGRRGSDGPMGALRGTTPDGKPNQVSPNPTVNLNSCHEMEGTIYPNFETASDDELRTWMTYRKNLGKATFADCQEGAGLDERLIRATALQRCEAFLRTFDLYED